MVSKEERLETQTKSNSAKVESWPIADRILSIRDSRGLSGVWSPVLCANGVLKWDNDLRSYSMIPLGNCESAYSKKKLLSLRLTRASAAPYHFLEYQGSKNPSVADGS